MPSLNTHYDIPLDEEIMIKARKELDIKKFALATENIQREEVLKNKNRTLNMEHFQDLVSSARKKYKTRARMSIDQNN